MNVYFWESHLRRIRCSFQLLALSLLLFISGGVTAKDRIEFDDSAEALLLELHFEGRSVANRAAYEALREGKSYQAPPALRIFGNGRILLHRYVADEFREIVLPSFELQELLSQLLDAGIQDLDADELKATLEAQSRARYEATGRIRLSTDLPTWRLTFQLESYSPEGGNTGPVNVQASWRSLSDSQREDDVENEVIRRFISVESILSDFYRRVERNGTETEGQ